MAITVKLQYLKQLELYRNEKPYRIFANIPKNAPDQRLGNLEFEDINTSIHELRREGITPTLDSHGFALWTHPRTLSLDEYKNRSIVDERYLPMMESLLKEEDPTIHKVFFFDWRLRSSKNDATFDFLDLNDYTTFLRPAQEVHVDQSPISALQRVESQLPNEAEELLKGRVRILNLWRPLLYPVEDYPLAFCNGATVNEEDLIASDHVRRKYTGETYYVRHRDYHKWYYIDRQQPEEVLVMKMFDSKEGVKARGKNYHRMTSTSSSSQCAHTHRSKSHSRDLERDLANR